MSLLGESSILVPRLETKEASELFGCKVPNNVTFCIGEEKTGLMAWRVYVAGTDTSGIVGQVEKILTSLPGEAGALCVRERWPTRHRSPLPDAERLFGSEGGP